MKSFLFVWVQIWNKHHWTIECWSYSAIKLHVNLHEYINLHNLWCSFHVLDQSVNFHWCMLNLIHKTTNNHAKDKLKKNPVATGWLLHNCSFIIWNPKFFIHCAAGLPVTRSHYSNDEVRWSNIACTKCYQYSNSLENCCILFSKLQCILLSESPTVEDKFLCHTTKNCISLNITVFIQRCYLAFIIFF